MKSFWFLLLFLIISINQLYSQENKFESGFEVNYLFTYLKIEDGRFTQTSGYGYSFSIFMEWVSDNNIGISSNLGLYEMRQVEGDYNFDFFFQGEKFRVESKTQAIMYSSSIDILLFYKWDFLRIYGGPIFHFIYEIKPTLLTAIDGKKNNPLDLEPHNDLITDFKVAVSFSPQIKYLPLRINLSQLFSVQDIINSYPENKLSTTSIGIGIIF